MPIRLVPGFVAYKADVDAGRPQIVRGAEGLVYASSDSTLSSPLNVLGAVSEAPEGNPTSNFDGVVEAFKVDVPSDVEGVFWVSDEYPIFQPFLGRNGKDGVDGVDGSNVIPTESAVRSIVGITSAGSGEPDQTDSSKNIGGSAVTNLARNPSFRATAGTVNLPAPVPVKAGSFNMRLASIPDAGDRAWSARKTAFGAAMIASGAEIVGFQEVSYVTDPVNSQAVDAITEINGVIGTNKWKTVGATDGSNAIAWDDTKLERLSEPTTVYVNRANTEGETRTLVWAMFQHRASKARFVMCCTHWQHNSPDATNGDVRRRESANIVADTLDDVRAQYGVPVVIAADFNDDVLSAGSPRSILVQRGYLESRALLTGTVINGDYNSHNNWDPSMGGKKSSKWIDGIHVSSGIGVTGAGVMLDFTTGSSLPLKTPLPSDHNMIWAGLSLLAAPAVRQQYGDKAVQAGGGATVYQSYIGGNPVVTVDGRGATSATGTSVYLGPNGAAGSAAQLGLTPGATYTIAVDCIIPVTLGDSSSSWARSIVVTTPGVGNYVSAAAPQTAGTYRLSFTFTPADKTYIRLYHGYDAGLIHWDNLMIVAGNVDHPFFDGNTVDAWWGVKVDGIPFNELIADGVIPDALARAIAGAVRPFL